MLYHITTSEHIEKMRRAEEKRIEEFRTLAIKNLREGNSHFEVRSYNFKERFTIDLLDGMNRAKWCKELADFFETASPEILRSAYFAISFLPNEKLLQAQKSVCFKVAEILWAHRLEMPSVEALKAAAVLKDSEVPFPED